MRANCKLLILFLVFAGRVESAQPDTGELHRLQTGLERMLNENIVSFWYPETLDPAGGFRLHHDGFNVCHFHEDLPRFKSDARPFVDIAPPSPSIYNIIFCYLSVIYSVYLDYILHIDGPLKR